MSKSKHRFIPKVALSAKTVANLNAQQLINHKVEEVWSMDRAVPFWILLALSGWLISFGVARLIL